MPHRGSDNGAIPLSASWESEGELRSGESSGNAPLPLPLGRGRGMGTGQGSRPQAPCRNWVENMASTVFLNVGERCFAPTGWGDAVVFYPPIPCLNPDWAPPRFEIRGAFWSGYRLLRQCARPTPFRLPTALTQGHGLENSDLGFDIGIFLDTCVENSV